MVINETSDISYNSIKSDIGMLSEQFLRGDVFTLHLSEYVFGNIIRVKEGDYTHCLKEVKGILSSARRTFYGDLVIIKSASDLTEDQKVVLVRYINMCHHDKKLIILFNEDIIYIPIEFIVDYGKESIYIHINTMYRKYTNERKLKYINKKMNVKKLIPFFH